MTTRLKFCTLFLLTLFFGVVSLKAQESYSLASADIDLNETLEQPVQFMDLNASDVIEILEEFTGKSIIKQGELKAENLSYKSREGDTVGDVIVALESLLNLNGVSVAPISKNLLKAVGTDKIANQAPTLIEGSTLEIPPSQQTYAKFFQINFLSIKEAEALLKALLTEKVSIVSDEKSNSVLITDSLVNLQRVERVLQKLDQSASEKSLMIVYQPNFISAEDLSTELKQLAEGGLKNRLAQTPYFESDKRTNQLIIFTAQANERIIRDLINQLDKDVAPITKTEVYNIKHATAEDIVKLIQNVINNQEKNSDEDDNTPSKAGAATSASTATATADSAKDSLQFSKYVSLVSDERANTILVTGTASDQKHIRALIDKMDVFLPQVRIEVLIAEVNLNNDEASGIQKLGLLYKKTAESQIIGDNDSIENIDNAYGWITDSINYGTGIALGPLAENPLDSFQLVLDTAKSNDDVNVLSAPTVMTTHNREAEIVISTQRPIITSTNNYTDTSNVSSSVQYKDIGLELKVTPLISSNNIIQMDIEQKYENVVGQITVNGNEQPIIGSRRTTSYISVADGQLIVLGGLQSVDESDSKSKMAILGDIPILGDKLFTYKSKSNQRTELLILVRPKIFRTPEEVNKDATNSIDNFPKKEVLQRFKETGYLNIKEESKKGTSEEKGKTRYRGKNK